MKDDEMKIGEDIEENPGESKLRRENKFIPILIVIIVSITIGLVVFFVSNSIFNPKKKDTKTEIVSKTLNLNDENVEILYSYVTYGVNNTRGDKFIKEQNVFLNSFTNYEKFYYALMFASYDDFTNTGEVDANNNKIYSISNSKIKEYMIRYFGPNVSYSTTSEIKYFFNFTINGNNYGIMNYDSASNSFNTIFINYRDGSNSKDINYYTKLSSAKSFSDGTLEIKEKIIYVATENNKTNIYKDYQHNMLIESVNNSNISIDDYLSRASTITYKFSAYNNTYYFDSSSIENSSV